MARMIARTLVAVVMLIAVGAASAETVVLRQGVNGYTGCTDTYIDYEQPAANYGTLWYGHAYMAGDDPERSVLIRFDLTGVVPPGAFVSEATLSMWVYQLVDFTSGDWLSIGPHRIRDYRDWIETQATWFYIKGTTYWATNGCENTTFDRYFDPDSWQYFYDSSPVSMYYHWDVTSSVRAWVAGAQNNGWLMRILEHDGGSDGLSFNMKESSSAAYRPYLTITYELPSPVEGSSWSRIKGLYR